jgi:hypothetical protein
VLVSLGDPHDPTAARVAHDFRLRSDGGRAMVTLTM